jgi:RNA polymerase sigma-70 factor (ECF subfamily)
VTVALITDLDDRTLVEQHRAGDPDAFKRIVVRHHRSLYANALRRLADPAAAEDAVQDAFLRAFRNLERFDGDYHLDAWLHRIVTNTCHDIGRRRGRDTRLFDRACTEVEVEAAPADESLDATPREQISEALDALPESYREALLLRFVDELSYSDVAEKAGISEENARARVSRGRSMLKRMLTSASALVVWAIPPLRRQTQLGGAEAEAANQAAAQVHGIATIAASAPAPTQAFNQVSGIIAQAGPAIATAGPAVSTTAPTLKAAVAVGIAAVAIPAGVAVDRAREKPVAPVVQVEEESAAPAVDAPVVVERAAEAAPTTVPASVEALAMGEEPVTSVISAEPTTSTSTPTEAEASTSTSTSTSTSAPGPSTSTPPPADGSQTSAPAPAPAPEPSDEPAPSEPAPTPATPGQVSASITLAEETDQVSGPVKLEIGDQVLSGQLTGKLTIAEAAPKSEGRREVERSTFRLQLDDGRVMELTVRGWSTVTERGNGESHALSLTFLLQGADGLDLATEGELRGTFETRHGGGELGLAIPGATRDS